MRRPDWESRLIAFVEVNRARPHAYGQWDCLLMSAGAVKAVTGKDHGTKKHRGKYRSAATASRYLRSLGFDSAEAMLDGFLPEKPVGFAHRGDLVLASDGVPALCMGEFALSVGEQGFVTVPRADWRKAWRVG